MTFRRTTCDDDDSRPVSLQLKGRTSNWSQNLGAGVIIVCELLSIRSLCVSLSVGGGDQQERSPILGDLVI